MKNPILILLLALSPIVVHSQIVAKPDVIRIRKVYTRVPTKDEFTIRTNSVVSRNGKNVLLDFEDDGEEIADIMEYFTGTTVETLSDKNVKTELAHFKNLYNSGRDKRIFWSSTWRSRIKAVANIDEVTADNTQIILQFDSSKRDMQGVSAQAIAGFATKLDNNITNNAQNFFELGSRLSDMRVKVGTRLRYVLEKDTKLGGGHKFTLTAYQKARYLYFDFISRGVIAFDSLSTVTSEYINSLQGAPLSFRLNTQYVLSNPVKQIITGKQEPNVYLNFLFDARLMPIAMGEKTTSGGGSFNFIPALTFSLPAAKNGDAIDGDRLIIQLTGNFAYLTPSSREAVFAGAKEFPISTSFEARVALYSEIEPTRNFNVLVRYLPQNVNGAKATLGISFAPQVKKTSE